MAIDILSLFRSALDEYRMHQVNEFRKMVPFPGEPDNTQWIVTERYEKISPIVIDYLMDTRGVESLTLLRDATRQIYRFSLDRNDIDPKKSAKAQQDFWGVRTWKHIDRWQYHDALTDTAWYLINGCRASKSATIHALKSLGAHRPESYVENTKVLREIVFPKNVSLN